MGHGAISHWNPGKWIVANLGCMTIGPEIHFPLYTQPGVSNVGRYCTNFIRNTLMQSNDDSGVVPFLVGVEQEVQNRNRFEVGLR